jgi:16S rRNA (guanine966-N2)-methyltransferase
MRIVGGKHAGRHLTSPGGKVRPTSEEVRDAWVAMLANELRDARVLELFAGTGAVGLEALSRGARSVDFVENGASSLHALKANLAALRVQKQTRLFKRDAIPFVERLTERGRPRQRRAPEQGPPEARFPYDVCLADPPYGSRAADRVVKAWLAAPFSAVLSVETAADHELPPGGRTRRFGDTRITTYRAERTGARAS